MAWIMRAAICHCHTPQINTKLKNDEIWWNMMKKNCPMHATASLGPIASFYIDSFSSHLVAFVCWRPTTHHSPIFFVLSLHSPSPFPSFFYLDLPRLRPPLQETTWFVRQRDVGSGLTSKPSGLRGSELRLGVGHALYVQRVFCVLLIQ
jgi:hypothetical protein